MQTGLRQLAQTTRKSVVSCSYKPKDPKTLKDIDPIIAWVLLGGGLAAGYIILSDIRNNTQMEKDRIAERCRYYRSRVGGSWD